MTAPSFSSFPPIFDSFPELPPEGDSTSRRDESEELKSSDLHSRKHRKRREDRLSKEHTSHASGREDRKREKLDKQAERKDTREEKHHKRRSGEKLGDGRGKLRCTTSSEGDSRVFYQDHKGDALNITYGGLYAGDIPKYWLVARGKKILGLDPSLTVLYRGGRGLEIGITEWHSRSPQLSDSRTRALLASCRTRRLVHSSDALARYTAADDFIKVSSHKKESTVSRYDLVGSDTTSSYESMDDTSDYDSDTSPMTAREESLREIEMRLKENPKPISDWLLLVRQTLSGMSTSAKNTERARAEITLSILSRALTVHTDNSRSALLRLKYLKFGESVWHGDKLNDEWEDALKAVRSSDMIIEWLDWRMRTSPNIDRVLEDGKRAYELVARDLSENNAESTRLRIFWRMAIFFKQSGFIERGFALFQAQAELLFHIPEEVKELSFQQQLDALEEFWDSELPRLGEVSALGWKAWKAKGYPESQYEPSQRPTVAHRELSDPFRIWQHGESEYDKKHFLPSRTTDVNEDDPYSTILFSDIRPFLIKLERTEFPNLFRRIWISFMSLHMPGLSLALCHGQYQADDRWANLPLMNNYYLQDLIPSPRSQRFVAAESIRGTIVGREKLYRPSLDIIRSWSFGAVAPLDGLFGQFRMWKQGHMESLDSATVMAIRNIFKQIRHKNEDYSWDILNLAYEASSTDLQSASKLSQDLIVDGGPSSELLAAHALLERMKGKNEKARKVYRVGLSSLMQSESLNVALLWWGSAEHEWLASRSDEALDIILRATGQTDGRSGIQVLRAKRRIEELYQTSLSYSWNIRLSWIKLRILIELLTGTVEAAISVVENYQTSEAQMEEHHESLTVTSLLMLHHHLTTLQNYSRRSLLRVLVRKALRRYPSNSVVVGLFLEYEKGESVWGRVRAFMDENEDMLAREKDVARRLIEVWIASWEVGCWHAEIERVRGGLEAGVTADRTKGSAILWMIYVKFEIASGDLKRAKTILFRALGECPFVKEFYLLAFDDDLRQVFNDRELIGLSDAMAERGLRLRQSLNEMLEMNEDWDVVCEMKKDKRKPVGEEDENEFERDSREQRRLMPY